MRLEYKLVDHLYHLRFYYYMYLLHNGCVLNGPASWCLVGILCTMGSVDMVLCRVLGLPSVRGRSPSSSGDLKLAHLCAEAVYTLHTV